MAERNSGDMGGKGFFGHARLRVARVYTFPSARRKVILAGAVLVAALVLFAVFDLTLGGAAFVSSGTLSSSHATLDPGTSCNSCHTPLAGVSDAQCESCHERYDDPVGIFSLASHRSVATKPLSELESEPVEREVAKSDCADCHLEHQGRLASIVDVGNASCQSCHDVDSFEDDHPEFDHVRLALPERSGLIFTHVAHVRRLLKRDEIETAENACASCHGLRDGAKRFEPLSFDQHCSSCHLGADSATEALAIARVPQSGVFPVDAEIGVETLASVRKRQPLGSDWTSRMSDRGFTVEGKEVIKLRVQHEDPWIMHNLALLRSRLVEPGLAGLLRVQPDSTGDYSLAVYREAVASLEKMNATLAASVGADDDEVVEALGLVREKIALLRARIEDPNEDLDATAFADQPRAGVSEEQRDQILDFAAEVGGACWQCHEGRDASIVRPQRDQRVLRNARFDHSAHVIQRGCLDCHIAIPIAEFADNKETVPKALEEASIINVPGIFNCQECHSSSQASDQCVGCHDYHPHQQNRARFVQRSELAEVLQ